MSSGHIIDQDGKFIFIVDGLFTSLKIADNGWIGLGAAKGRIEFDDQAMDEINFLDCRVGIGTSTPDANLEIAGSTVQVHLDGSSSVNLYLDRGTIGHDVFTGYQTAGAFGWVTGIPRNTNFGDGTEYYIGTGTNAPKVVIQTVGNVLIGTTSVGTNAAGTFAMALGTDPTADVANQFAFWGKDFAVGNTSPYFRTENGTVIGLNQSLLTTDNVIHSRLALTGGFSPNLVTKTTNYTATADDYTILCNATSASFTITLPAVASHTNRIYNIKKIDSSANTVTVDGNSSETIDDGTTAVLTTQYESITIQSDGSEWWII